jgi:hypothetical protein
MKLLLKMKREVKKQNKNGCLQRSSRFISENQADLKGAVVEARGKRKMGRIEKNHRIRLLVEI